MSRRQKYPSWSKPGQTEKRQNLFNPRCDRTPVTGNIRAARDKREINVFGCGLAHTVAEMPKDAQFTIGLNLTTPYMPITSDGKEPT